ncbi:MAG: major tail protein [Prevotella sp.]
MAIAQSKPSIVITVGAQYICLDTPDKDGSWTDKYAEEVTKLPTVVSAEVKDTTDSYDAYSSGNVYDTDTDVLSEEISVENIAFPAQLVAKLRGDTVDSGIIMSGGLRTRPWFAYGIPIINKDGSKLLRWYPKCKLTDNDDKTETSEDKHKDQNKTLTIKAYQFNDAADIKVEMDTSDEAAKMVTEDTFFAVPLTTFDAAKALETTTATG